MVNTITVKNSRLGAVNKIPWTFLIIAYLVVAHTSQIDLTGIAGYVFIGLAVVVLFLEFFKSGDISTSTFLVDVITAVIGVTIATALLAYMYFKLEETPNFFHWFGYAIIVGDAIMSPFNAFRTALRNFGVGA